MIETVLVHGLHKSKSATTKGGVDLRSVHVGETLAKRGITTGDTSGAEYFLGSEGLIYVPTQGFLSAQYLDQCERWLNRGWTVVEHNIFGLASPFRPNHPNYFVAVSSADTAQRFQFRQRLRAGLFYPRIFLLPHPIVWENTVDNIIRNDRTISFCRLGRPDRRKWTDFELKYVASLAKARPDLNITLDLFGSPYPVEPSRLDNLAIHSSPYTASVSSVLSTRSFYIHESRIGETYGNILLEALAAGLRIIAAGDPAKDAGHFEVLEGHASVLGTRASLIRNAGKSFQDLRRKEVVSPDIASISERFFDRLLDPWGSSQKTELVDFDDHIDWLNSQISFGRPKPGWAVRGRIAAGVLRRWAGKD